MVDSVPVLNATKREDTIHLLSDAPTLSSEQSGWSNLFFAYFHHPAFIPEGEFCFDRHGLAISETAFAVERRTEGIRQQVQFAPRRFDVGRGNQPVRSTTGDYSVLVLDGSLHTRQRKLLMPPFHGDRMKAYGEIICQITEQVSQSWQPRATFTAQSQMQRISLQVILRTIFGLTDGDRLQQFQQHLTNFLKYTASPFFFAMVISPSLQWGIGPWQPWQRYLDMLQTIDELLYAEIRERRQTLDSTHTDILSLLLAARDEAGEPMTDVELRDELITFLIAGHETTAIALSWAL